MIWPHLCDKIPLEHVFEILQQFEKASGLRVNEEKTEAYWLGSSHNCMLNLSIRKVNEPMKILGVYFMHTTFA